MGPPIARIVVFWGLYRGPFCLETTRWHPEEHVLGQCQAEPSAADRLQVVAAIAVPWLRSADELRTKFRFGGAYKEGFWGGPTKGYTTNLVQGSDELL